MCSSAALGRMSGAITTVCVCLVLAGCPSVSNPTQSQAPPASGPPPPSGSAASTAGSPPQSASASDAKAQRSATAAGQSQSDRANSGSAATDGSASPGGAQAEGDNAGQPSLDDKEPVFAAETAGTDSLPDLRDEPRATAASNNANNTDNNAPAPEFDNTAGPRPQTGGPSTGNGGALGDNAVATQRGMPGGNTSGGPLTPAEQVAILDAQLERSADDFDAIILTTQAEQRAVAREQATQNPTDTRGGAASGGLAKANSSPYDGAMAGAGGYSTGGGMGGSGGGGATQSSAKYPPPDDIPGGNDDDVVARQLREAASRETDPAVREKLWDEYRKYKGIER